jgi:hypothetical protein
MILLGARRAQERWAGDIARDQRRGARSPLKPAREENRASKSRLEVKDAGTDFPDRAWYNLFVNDYSG